MIASTDRVRGRPVQAVGEEIGTVGDLLSDDQLARQRGRARDGR